MRAGTSKQEAGHRKKKGEEGVERRSSPEILPSGSPRPFVYASVRWRGAAHTTAGGGGRAAMGEYEGGFS